MRWWRKRAAYALFTTLTTVAVSVQRSYVTFFFVRGFPNSLGAALRGSAGTKGPSAPFRLCNTLPYTAYVSLLEYIHC
jgi:hypothetical protein